MAQERRLKFHTLLKVLLGSEYVYFQPPASITMSYPAIVYMRNNVKTEFANNLPYSHTKRYMVTVIDRKADSDIPTKVSELPLSSFSRHFTADGLHHDVYDVYF